MHLPKAYSVCPHAMCVSSSALPCTTQRNIRFATSRHTLDFRQVNSPLRGAAINNPFALNSVEAHTRLRDRCAYPTILVVRGQPGSEPSHFQAVCLRVLSRREPQLPPSFLVGLTSRAPRNSSPAMHVQEEALEVCPSRCSCQVAAWFPLRESSESAKPPGYCKEEPCSPSDFEIKSPRHTGRWRRQVKAVAISGRA